MNPEYSPAIFHLSDTEFPRQVVALGVVDGRNPRALGNSEVVNEYGVTYTHTVKGIASQGGHLYPRLRRINSEIGVQHTSTPAMVSLKHRHRNGILESKFQCNTNFSIGELKDSKSTLRALHTLRATRWIHTKKIDKFEENVKFVRIWGRPFVKGRLEAFRLPLNLRIAYRREGLKRIWCLKGKPMQFKCEIEN